MLPGAAGSRWMPRKIAGIEMITIEASIVAMNMPSVVLDSATHLYRPGAPSPARLQFPGVLPAPLSPPFSLLTANYLN